MATNNIIPIVHHGLAGKFTRADGLQTQNVAGIQYGKLQWPAGTPLRMACGRLAFEMLEEHGNEFYFGIDLADMTMQTPVAGVSWSGSGDLDEDAAAFGTDVDRFAGLLGVELHAVVTSRGAVYGDGTITLQAGVNASPSSSGNGTIYNLVQAGTATPNPSALAPWWGVALLGTNTGFAMASQGMQANDSLILSFSALAGTGFAGYVDVVLVAKGS